MDINIEICSDIFFQKSLLQQINNKNILNLTYDLRKEFTDNLFKELNKLENLNSNLN